MSEKHKHVLIRKIMCADCGTTCDVIEYERYRTIYEDHNTKFNMPEGSIYLCKMCKDEREVEDDE